MTSPRMRTICPECKGGPTQEKSLTLYRSSTYLAWTCYRASCGLGKGYSYLPVPDRLHFADYAPGTYKQVLSEDNKVFKGELRQLSKTMEMDMFLRWEIPPKQAAEEGFKTAVTQDRLYMPVMLVDNEEIGAVLRCLRKPSRHPKTVNYIVPNKPLLHFPTNTIKELKGTLVLVEDIISAVKASLCGVPTAALLGAALNEREVLYLKNIGITKLIIALDQDTWFKDNPNSVNIKKQWGLYFNSIELKYLTKDLKDTSIQDIKHTFDVT